MAGFTLGIPAPAPGAWTLDVIAGLDPATVERDHVMVLPPSDERRDPRLDRAALDALATGTGGRVFTDAKTLVAALPDLTRSEQLSAVRGWWDTIWALLLIVSLFAVDWAIRRWNRLP